MDILNNLALYGWEALAWLFNGLVYILKLIFFDGIFAFYYNSGFLTEGHGTVEFYSFVLYFWLFTFIADFYYMYWREYKDTKYPISFNYLRNFVRWFFEFFITIWFCQPGFIFILYNVWFIGFFIIRRNSGLFYSDADFVSNPDATKRVPFWQDTIKITIWGFGLFMIVNFWIVTFADDVCKKF